MKRLLIFEPNTTSGIKIVNTAKNMGIYVIAVTSENLFKTIYPKNLKNNIDECVFCNFNNREENIKDIFKTVKNYGINGVVSGFEFFSDWAISLAHLLNVPTNNYKNVEVFRDKLLMSRLFKKYHIPSPKTFTISSSKSVKIQDFPILVKPSNNAGSFGVIKVNNKKELDLAIKNIKENDTEFPHGFKLNSKIICQEILVGPEISVEVIANKGQFHLLAFTEKITTKGKYSAELGHIIPAPIDKYKSFEILDNVFSAMRVMGFINGVAHAELIITNNGPRIIEIGARLPGDFIPDLLEKALGINEAKLYIESVMGNDINIKHTKEGFAGIKFITTNKKIKFKKISCTNQLSTDTSLLIYSKKGDIINPTHDNMSRIGHISTYSDSYLQLINKLNIESNKLFLESD
ncbi:D-alanine--D-alanine ligase [Apilactobacillus kunkeei]|nr:D-alanine--D-alanine ligase [Apilactobacillus kunkeei]CAI2578703.1 D-alanine--D-alanine ligase [Apilactobacillus kunkeei]